MTNFDPFGSYHLTWYGDAGLYGEPLPSNQDILYEDNSFWVNEVQQDIHLSGNGLFPYNEWLGEFESYFIRPEKSDDLFTGEVMQHGSSYYVDDPGLVYIGNQWLDSLYEYDDYNYYVRQETEGTNADSWNETRLVENILGRCPSILKLNLEDQTEPTLD